MADEKLSVKGFPEELEKYLRPCPKYHLIPEFHIKILKPPEDMKLMKQISYYIDRPSHNNILSEMIAEQVEYVGPVREPIPRYGFIGSMHSLNLGPGGKNLMRVISSKGIGEKSLIKKLNNWLDVRFHILKNIRLKNVDKQGTIKSLIADDYYGGKDINLCAMGCGISQIVPIIIQSLLLRQHGCLLVEQPEIHLHPKAQADLEDFFISGALKDRQFIVETHSEHLILRIRRRIAEGKIPPSRVKIYIVSKHNGKTRFKPLELNENGGFSEWPDDFFDESYNETLAIAKANINKGESS